MLLHNFCVAILLCLVWCHWRPCSHPELLPQQELGGSECKGSLSEGDEEEEERCWEGGQDQMAQVNFFSEGLPCGSQPPAVLRVSPACCPCQDSPGGLQLLGLGLGLLPAVTVQTLPVCAALQVTPVLPQLTSLTLCWPGRSVYTTCLRSLA